MNSKMGKVAKNNHTKNDAQDPRDVLKATELINRLIEKETISCAQIFGIDAEELQAWINLQNEVPTKTILALLRMAKQYQLDPLKEEILLYKQDDEWQAIISIDGWIKLINEHSAVTGISFRESPNPENEVPAWIECTIHRSDRITPITIREYFSEVSGESEIWKKMPRRMLRHRALQQCARLAIGVSHRTPTDHGKEGEKNHLREENPSIAPIRTILTSQITHTERLKALLDKHEQKST